MYFYDLRKNGKGILQFFKKEKGDDNHRIWKGMKNNKVCESPKCPVKKTQGVEKATLIYS